MPPNGVSANKRGREGDDIAVELTSTDVGRRAAAMRKRPGSGRHSAATSSDDSSVEIVEDRRPRPAGPSGTSPRMPPHSPGLVAQEPVAPRVPPQDDMNALHELHNDVVEFLYAITPTEQEYQARVQLILDVKDAMAQVFPKYSVEVFGSARAGLALPGSDVDFCVFPEKGHISSHECTRAVNAASAFLRRRPDKFIRINRIPHARVPIVKCVHAPTRIEFDLSFIDTGIQSTEYLRAILASKQYKHARSLILVVKAILRENKLNDASQGGLGSFPLSLMVIAFMQATKCTDVDHFGVLLVNFLSFYGKDFPYERWAMDIRGSGSTFDKPPTSLLHIVNPKEPERNVASAAHKFGSKIRPLFHSCWLLLNASVPEKTPSFYARADTQRMYYGSVLGRIVGTPKGRRTATAPLTVPQRPRSPFCLFTGVYYPHPGDWVDIEDD